MFRRLLPVVLLFFAPNSLPSKPFAEDTAKPPAKTDDPLFSSSSYAGLKFRSLGPATCSGRIAAMAVHPKKRSTVYVAVASGGVWKTTNAGTTYEPIFDDQGSYSIGHVAIDPNHPETVWVGTGENNSQRSVGYGDGLYKSLDGGKSWKKVGLERSEHIGKILIDPRNSDTVYVAAQGPLWKSGGDRGLYKTTDGGKTWNAVLKISPETGVTDVVFDPRNPDILLAASYQRRRHVWTLVNGGPESAIHRSTDGGKTWSKITSGLPNVELGRISLAHAPSNPDIVYASVEAALGKGGIFRSVDGGLNWEKRNPFDRGAMYFCHVAVDPKNADRIYVVNVFTMMSEDGGKTLTRMPIKYVHVDAHYLIINPEDSDHILMGCDGGIYETHDRGKNWRHHVNLPVAQFYDITIDNTAPFYRVYGGTQDNNTLGGPVRSNSIHGITNQDWDVIHTGDGFQCKVDPRDPNIVYAEAQYGDLVRHDRKTGQTIGIRPHLPATEPPLRWNWDSPLVLSPHSPTRLYYAANRVFRSDDRGDSWQVISPDLTRQLDRDKLPVMGKIWSPDAVSKHQSTSLYGNLVALNESPLQEGLLYAGTDDGLLQVTEDNGKTWRKIEKFPEVPERTYVCRVVPSAHKADRVYAVFNNHKNGDFAPYLLVSNDRGKTWNSLTAKLPNNHPLWCIAEDPVEENLLFVGSEFGLFFTLDQGKQWTQLKGGLPTIAVRDLAIHPKMVDLVIGTFGRGFYVLDDYSPLRKVSRDMLKAPATLAAVRTAHQFVPTRQYGLKGKAFMGENLFAAENPPYGAVFTYHLGEELQTQAEKRRAAEKKAASGKENTIAYPSQDQLRAEAEEEAPAVVFEISAVGSKNTKVIRRVTGPVSKGWHRVSWDLREAGPSLPQGGEEELFTTPNLGPQVLPGKYVVQMFLRREGKLTEVAAAKQFFDVALVGEKTSPERAELYAFQTKIQTLKKAVLATTETVKETQGRLVKIRKAVDETPALTAKDRAMVNEMEQRLRDIQRRLSGDAVLRARNENTPTSIEERISTINEDLFLTLGKPTKTHELLYADASKGLAEEVEKLRGLIERDLREIEKRLDAQGAAWTPGRLPSWSGK
jgi:photosystem II stability/assembly factor-like uncharacterized protein